MTRYERRLNNEFCRNAEPGTYGHECGKPATWIGTRENGSDVEFCDDCKENGYEARGIKIWRKQEVAE